MSETSLDSLLDAISQLYRCDGAAFAMLARAADAIDRLGTRDVTRATVPCRLPVCRHLAQAFAQDTDPAVAGIARAFAAIEPELDWRQNVNYVAAPPDPGFLGSYGYVELIGATGGIARDDLAVGFLLLGPGTYYPAHSHPAEELYHVVSGTAEWWRSGCNWTPVPSGAAIHHPSQLEHAMRTRTDPLLALYCWTGAVTIAARLTDPPRGNARRLK